MEAVKSGTEDLSEVSKCDYNCGNDCPRQGVSELPHYCEESGEELELDGDYYLQTPTVKEHTQGIMWTKYKMLVSNIQ